MREPPTYVLKLLFEQPQRLLGGVILISHDERFITSVSRELWVCGDGKVSKYYGDVTSYKVGNAHLRKFVACVFS